VPDSVWDKDGNYDQYAARIRGEAGLKPDLSPRQQAAGARRDSYAAGQKALVEKIASASTPKEMQNHAVEWRKGMNAYGANQGPGQKLINDFIEAYQVAANSKQKEDLRNAFRQRMMIATAPIVPPVDEESDYMEKFGRPVSAAAAQPGSPAASGEWGGVVPGAYRFAAPVVGAAASTAGDVADTAGTWLNNARKFVAAAPGEEYKSPNWINRLQLPSAAMRYPFRQGYIGP
jgi:hypothetical protein